MKPQLAGLGGQARRRGPAPGADGQPGMATLAGTVLPVPPAPQQDAKAEADSWSFVNPRRSERAHELH